MTNPTPASTSRIAKRQLPLQSSSPNRRAKLGDSRARSNASLVFGDLIIACVRRANSSIAVISSAADIAEKQSKVKVNETTAALNIARAKHLANDTTLRVHEATQPQPEAANDEDALISDAIAEARQVSR